MKKYASYIVLFLTGSLFTACNDFLTENLKNDYNSETFYTSESNALRAINGAYNAISFTSSSNLIWVFGDVASDDSQKGGNPGDLADITAIEDFTAQPDNGILNTYWTFVYEAISRTNNVIAYVPGIDMDEEVRDRIVGEAKFIRAYSYFNLVNIWGPVPLRLTPPSPQQANLAVSSVSEIYAAIEQDLKEAVASPLAVSYTSTNQGRVTRGAAYGLLAKTYLYQGKYAECLQAIAELENLGIYSLENQYENLFRMGAESSPEVIFAIQHMSGQNPGLGNILNVYFAPAEENGYYFNAPEDSYVAVFDERTAEGETDPRLDASIGWDGYPWLNDDLFDANWSATGYLVKKHNQPLSEVPIGTKADGNLPYIYLRYADILLMKAEALNENGGNLGNALAALNLVRNRAGLAPSTASD